MTKYNIYHSQAKICYSLGLEKELLPKAFTKDIPRSTWLPLFTKQKNIEITEIIKILKKRESYKILDNVSDFLSNHSKLRMVLFRINIILFRKDLDKKDI